MQNLSKQNFYKKNNTEMPFWKCQYKLTMKQLIDKIYKNGSYEMKRKNILMTFEMLSKPGITLTR